MVVTTVSPDGYVDATLDGAPVWKNGPRTPEDMAAIGRWADSKRALLPSEREAYHAKIAEMSPAALVAELDRREGKFLRASYPSEADESRAVIIRELMAERLPKLLEDKAREKHPRFVALLADREAQAQSGWLARTFLGQGASSAAARLRRMTPEALVEKSKQFIPVPPESDDPNAARRYAQLKAAMMFCELGK
jgi:hypothetical protein